MGRRTVVPDGPNDDNAIDDSKSALLSGTATFANYTGYSRGINGIMVDIANAGDAASITAADFVFRVGNPTNFSSFTDFAPDPESVTVDIGGGEGGSDRVVIIWDDNDIEGEWLEVTVLANASTTGLATPDVHYWGNAPGDTGNNGANTVVDAFDVNDIRLNFNTFLSPADPENPYDINKNRLIDAFDVNDARLEFNTFLSDLNLITFPGGGGGSGSGALLGAGADYGDDDEDALNAIDQAIGQLF